jgi:DNA-binding NarL/FixJ family response regulator
MITRIVLADDHVLFRQALRQLLDTEADFQVVGEAANGQEAIDLVLAEQPDVVLMDLNLPEVDGVTATQLLHDRCPAAHVVISSENDADSSMVSAIRAGAIGYLCKTATIPDLLQTIVAAAQGQVTFSAAASARLVQELHAPVDEPEHLTGRELEVLTCIAQGLSNKEIAWKLRISEKTVKSHVSTILGKFGMESRTQAALYATRRGLVANEPAAPLVPVVRGSEHPIISIESRRTLAYTRARGAAS